MKGRWSMTGKMLVAGWGLLAAITLANAATIDVATVTQFQNALNLAATNRQDDVLRVVSGTYYLDTTLTYNAATNENTTLVIQCADGGTAIIDASSISMGAMRGLWITTSGTVADVVLDGLTVQGGHTTSTDTGSGRGAGVYLFTRYGNQTLRNCTIRRNTGTELFNTVDAAGAYLKLDMNAKTVTLRNCTFSNNYAKGTGGGAYITAGYGAAVSMVNNLFISNGASTAGGGAYIYTISGSLMMDNNTFVSNWTGYGYGGGGAYIKQYWNDDVAILRNNILWGNMAGNGIGSDIYFEDDGFGDGTGAFINIFNCVYSNIAYHVGDHVSLAGNTNAHPRLTTDLRLRAGSPCIDAGTNLAWMTGATDMRGRPRIFNGRVDMGIDEATVMAVGLSVSNGIAMRWDTIVDAVCQLQGATNLTTPEWSDVGGATTAASVQITISDTNTGVAARMYRLRCAAPP